MKLRPIYCLAIASLVAAPVTWYVWTEQSPLERDLAALAREYGLEEVAPQSVGLASDDEFDYRVFAAQEITAATAKSMADRFDKLDRRHDGQHLDRCLSGEGFDQRIVFARSCFVFHNGGITHFWLYSEDAAPNRFILSIRRERLTLQDRLKSLR